MDSRQTTTIAKLQRHLDELPVLPVVLVGLLNANPDGDTYFEEVEHLVSSDPAFATRLLRYANSAASAPGRSILKVHEALSRLGCTMAVNLILAASAAKVFVPRHAWAKELWVHALDVAALAKALCPLAPRSPKVDLEEAYVCGLLHDIGRFILYLEAPESLRQIDELEWGTPAELVFAEQQVCGFTHAELGGIAAQKWGLPASMAEVIRFHHEPPPASTPQPLARLIEVVRAADWIDVALMKRGGCRAMSDAALNKTLTEAAVLDGYSVDARLVQVVRGALDEADRLRQTLGL